MSDTPRLNWYSVNGMALQSAIHLPTVARTYRFLATSQWWSEEQIEAYQRTQLKRFIRHAYDHVPYYRRLFDANGIRPGHITDAEALKRLPFLTKPLVTDNIESLKAQDYPSSHFEANITGGSSGYPLHFYSERGTWFARLIAYHKLMIEWTGCHLFDRSVSFDGYPQPWKYPVLGRILALSSYYMTDDNLQRYIELIRKYKPRFIFAYPSAPLLLANYMTTRHIDSFPSVKAIISYGETLFEKHRRFLEDTFHCRVFCQYGHREQSVLGSTCQSSYLYHLFPQYGITELVDKDGNPVHREGEIGEVVATGFQTGIFPFIRFRTGDMASYTAQKCTCGRHFHLIKNIEGRMNDYLISKTQRIVPLIEVHHLLGETTGHVREGQLYQDTPGELVVRIVKTNEYTEQDTRDILMRFQHILGEGFTISFEFVDEIPRTVRGKVQFLVQKLPVNLIP